MKRDEIVIPVSTKTRDGREWVDARRLHTALGVGRVFPTWIQARIRRFGLISGKDYVLSVIDGPHPSKEYDLSVDTAKALIHFEQYGVSSVPLTSFFHKGHKIRAFRRDGVLWFIAQDIGDIINRHSFMEGLAIDDDERTMYWFPRRNTFGEGHKFLVAFNERGVYHALFPKRKTIAKEAQRLVVDEFMPKIRNHFFVRSFLGRIISRIAPGFPLALPEKGAGHE